MTSKIIHDASVTRIKYEEIHYSWKIEDFVTCCKKTDKFLESPRFPKAESDDRIQWVLSLYPRGFRGGSDDYISVYLDFIPKTENDIVKAQYKCNLKGRIIECSNYDSFTFTKNDNDDPCCMCAVDFNWEEADLDLEDDVLIVDCSIKYALNITHNRDEAIALDKPDAHRNLSRDLHQLMEDGKFSDIKLLAKDGAGFPAHKYMLATRSPVFAAMFDNNMKESNESVVKIEDINGNTLKSLLEFMYSGKFVDEKCDIEELLVAADKYAIEDLKMLCENNLAKKLKVKNAISYLVLADSLNAKILKKQTLALISENLKELRETEAIKNLSMTRPSLLNDILETVANNLM